MNDIPTRPQPGELRTFTQFIQQLESGGFHDEASERLHDLLLACRAAALSTGGKSKGSMTLKFDFKLDGAAITVNSTITTADPKESRESSHFFMSDGAWLSNNHPRQVDMFGPAARAVPTPGRDAMTQNQTHQL